MPATMQNSTRLDPASAALDQNDWGVLENVGKSIQRGRELRDWWTAHKDTRVKINRFPLARQFRQTTENYGCLMEADLPSGSLQIAGVIQEQLFAVRKIPHADATAQAETARQLREFVMRHFMHVTSFQSGRANDSSDTALQARRGWGYEQAYYKLTGSGLIGKFAPEDRRRIGSLLEIGPNAKYEWIVFAVHIHNLAIPFDLTGEASGPSLTMRTEQVAHTVLTHDYLEDQTGSEVTQTGSGPKVVGRYGYGYSVVPDSSGKSLIAAGPGEITNTIEMLRFTALETGEIRARMVFLMPQAPRVLNFNPVGWSWDLADRLSLNMATRLFGPVRGILEQFEPRLAPVFMGLKLADMLTLGMAGDEFAMRKEDVYKSIMYSHFADVHRMFNIAGTHYSMVRDWTDTASLPDWASPAVERTAPPQPEAEPVRPKAMARAAGA